MPELPDRPDLGQLRRQARELLRAAANGEPTAVTRLQAVSDRVMLSAAQLAVAREYGYSSWSTLRAEVERRRLSTLGASPPLRGGEGLGVPAERWSFGGGTAIETGEGVLFPGALVISSGHATLDASLVPSGEAQRGPSGSGRLPRPGRRFGRALVGRRRPRSPRMPALGDVAVVDDRAASYTLAVNTMGGMFQRSGKAAGPVSMRLRIAPVPGREAGWVELRGVGDSATRLLPSLRTAVQVGQVTPVAASPAERELRERARSLIKLQLAGVGVPADDIRQRCLAALTRAAEIQRSGKLDPASELPGQLARLCAWFTGHRRAGGLPASWSRMLNAAHRTDGPRHHLDIGAALPSLDGVVTLLDSLISGPGSWQVYLRARPGWWNDSDDGRRSWTPLLVDAHDDLGGGYLSLPGDGTSHGDDEELTLEFLPRLDPRARGLKLTFSTANEEVTVDLSLASAEP